MTVPCWCFFVAILYLSYVYMQMYIRRSGFNQACRLQILGWLLRLPGSGRRLFKFKVASVKLD